MRIFPVNITKEGKKLPIIREWEARATSDPLQIEAWKKEYGDRITLWGVPTGSANGIVVVDLDVKNGIDGIQNAQAAQLNLPATTMQRTINGGIHLVYKLPHGAHVGNTTSKYAKGVDTRGEGGFICYYGYDQTPMADCPEWLIQAEKVKPTQSSGHNYSISPVLANQLLDAICSDVEYAPPSEANNVLNVKAYEAAQNLIGTGSLSRDFVFQRLLQAAQLRGKDAREATATIESGFAGGLRAPPRDICPFEPTPVVNMKNITGWCPQLPTRDVFFDDRFLKRPQNFKDWSSKDITVFTADGGSGKTTMMLNEAVCLALSMPFLGFACIERGNTLYITGEDTAEKIYAVTGKIMRQMELDDSQIDIVVKSILVKKDSDMCIVTKDKAGMIVPNHNALNNIVDAVTKHKPAMIVIDPISSFWGAEASLNDMTRAVAKFAGFLRDISNAQVVLVNHMGKQSSQTKDLSQFAGRGGSALPSHARIVRTMAKMQPDEYIQKTGKTLQGMQSGMVVYVSKFSDGSPICDKPMVLTRTGFLVENTAIIASERDFEGDVPFMQKVMDTVMMYQKQGKYLNEDALRGITGLSKDKIKVAANTLNFNGLNGYLLKTMPNPDVTKTEQVFIVTDYTGQEVR